MIRWYGENLKKYFIKRMFTVAVCPTDAKIIERDSIEMAENHSPRILIWHIGKAFEQWINEKCCNDGDLICAQAVRNASFKRLKLYRERKRAVEKLAVDMSKENLWDAIVAFAGYSFFTAKGLGFRYCVKGNEIFISRKEKSVTRSSVEVAFWRAVNMNGEIRGPKKLGVFGASYLYPIFVKLGVIRQK